MIDIEGKLDFRMSHPMQNGWYSRGISSLPEEATKVVTERYDGRISDVPELISMLDLVTSSVTAKRYTEELTNLNLCRTRDLKDEKFVEYENNAGVKDTIPAQLGWLAMHATAAFDRGVNDKYKKITLELGGTRQYGLWTFDGERTSKEVDDATFDLADDIRSKYPGIDLHSYEYEGATPIRYRTFMTPNDGFVIGRRRRAVLDAVIEGRKIQVFKQFRGLIPLEVLGSEYRDRLSDQFEIGKYKGEELKDHVDKINKATANIMRNAIHHKSEDPLSVCPIDVSLLMSTHRV